MFHATNDRMKDTVWRETSLTVIRSEDRLRWATLAAGDRDGKPTTLRLQLHDLYWPATLPLRARFVIDPDTALHGDRRSLTDQTGDVVSTAVAFLHEFSLFSICYAVGPS